MLGIGDHEFIKHDSFIAYHLMGKYSKKVLEKGVNDKSMENRDRFDDKLLALIDAGVTTSRFSSPAMKKYYSAQTASKSGDAKAAPKTTAAKPPR